MPTRQYKDNENPFAYPNNEGTEMGASGRTNNFDFFTGQGTAVDMPTGAGNVSSNTTPRLVKLQRWNIACRLGTFVLCLVAVILILISKQSKKGIPLDNGTRGSGTATYKFSGTFKFFLFVNIYVCLYALLLVVFSFMMSRRGTGLSVPMALTKSFLFLNLFTGNFLLLAFAAAVAVEVVTRQGLVLGDIEWIPICKYFGTFCALNEIALAACASGYLCLFAGTCIDAYVAHKLAS